METDADTEIGEVVRRNFKTAQVFKNHNIDYSCYGEIPLSVACRQSNTRIANLKSEIDPMLQVYDPDSRFIEKLSLEELSNYIVKRHHSYVKESIPFLQAKLKKLINLHGHKRPVLHELSKLFSEAADTLTAHVEQEEFHLFPFINILENFYRVKTISDDYYSIVQKVFDEIREDHIAERNRFEAISNLTDNYKVPLNGCRLYEVTYLTLEELDKDLQKHMHLESYVLNKKAIELYQKLITQKQPI